MAASVSELAREAGDAWTAASGREVRLQAGASSMLARQINEGAPADVFVSADAEWAGAVKAIERRAWLGNRLVAIAVEERPLAEVKSLALAGEQVPAGKYARAALAASGIALPPRLVNGATVRDVLAKVVEGAAEAGVVYETDARLEPRVRVIHRFPAATHPPIRYVAVLLTEEGRPLFEALRAPAALESARVLGFEIPGR